MDKKYVFKKAYPTELGVIPVGSEIYLFRNFVYFNGGMVQPSYAKFLLSLIEDAKLRNEYLEVHKIEKNEF